MKLTDGERIDLTLGDHEYLPTFFEGVFPEEARTLVLTRFLVLQELEGLVWVPQLLCDHLTITLVVRDLDDATLGVCADGIGQLLAGLFGDLTLAEGAELPDG
ncbi:hypothetical protein XMD509_002383 [Marinobacterium sp. xm-d-509]|nr:hypothetical protein [Marinobacterium sp. xm-d-509]